MLIALLLIGAALLLPGLAEACPGCKEALFDPGQLPQKLATAKGYAVSIGILLSVPFLIIAGFAAWIAHNSRRNKSTP